MTQLNPIHGALLRALAHDLPDTGSAVLVTVPGTGVETMLQQAKPNLTLIRTVSAAMCAALPALRIGLAANAAILPVAPKAFERFDVGVQDGASGNRASVRFEAFSDLLSRLSRPQLCYFGAAPRQAELLASALPVLTRKGLIAWLDLGSDAAAQGAALRAATENLDVEIFGLSPEGRLVALAGPQPLASVILLPRQAWDGDGLRRLAQSRVALAPGDLPGNLIVPTSRRSSAAVLAKLARLARPRRAAALGGPIRVTPATGLLCGASGQLKNGAILFGGNRLELILPAPSAGAFRLQIILDGAPVAAETAGLTARHGDREIGFVWSKARSAFEATAELVIVDPHQPIRLALSRKSDDRALQISALALHHVRAPQDAHPAP